MVRSGVDLGVTEYDCELLEDKILRLKGNKKELALLFEEFDV